MKCGISLLLVAAGVVGVVGRSDLRAAQQGAAQQPSFRAATALVEVDAIVKDRKGAFVADLTAADFEVLEDGVAQKVEQFYVVLGPTVKPVAPAAGAPPAAAAQAPLPATQTQRTFVLLFDQEHIEPGAFDRAKKAALQFMKQNFREGDIGGVATPSTMVNNRLTNVRTELEAAIAGLKPSGEQMSLRSAMRAWPRLLDAFEVYLIDYGDREAISRAVSRAIADDADAAKNIGVDSEVVMKARQLLPVLRESGQRTMRMVAALSNGMAKLQGRKTVVLLTDGFFVEDSWGNLRQIADLANRANVRVYTLDTRGLNRGTASSEIFEVGPHASATPAGEATGFDTASDGPNSLAVDTGGTVIRNENDFPKALDEIATDTSSYYILGYRSSNPVFDGKFRTLTVRVKRSGVSVRARKGYLATQPAASPAAQAGKAKAVPPPGAEPAPAAAANAPPTSIPLPAAANAASPANVPAPPRGVLRLQPDVRDRLVAAGTIAPERTTRPEPPAEVLAQARAGWEAYQKGDIAGARAPLAAAAQHPASPAWVHYALGWSEYGRQGYEPASVAWEHVRAVAPEFEPVYFDLADAYLQLKEFGKAIDVLRKAEQRWPGDVEVYNAIGSIQASRGALTDAVRTFEGAVVVNPNDATACYNLAKTSELRYIQSTRLRVTSQSLPAVLEDRDRAVEYYRRTITLGGQFVEQAREGLKRLGVV
jgi:VWFA-related protein